MEPISMSNMINRNGQRMPSSQDHRHRMMYRSNASPSPQSSRLPATPVMNRALPQYQRPDMQPLVNFSPSHQYYQPANVQPVINTYRRRSPQYQTHRPANMPIMAHENRRSPPRFGRPIQPMANENHPPLAQFGRLVNMPSNRLPIEIAQNLQSVRLPAEHDLLENCYKYLSGLTPEPVYGSEAFDGALKQFAQTANPIEHEHVYTIMKAKFEQIKKISAQFSFGPKPQLIQVELDQSASPGFSFTAKPTEFEEVERLKNHPCFEIPLNSFVYDKADYPRADTVAATTTTKGKSPKGQKKAPPTEVERASWVPPTSCPVYREKLAQDMVEALQDGSNAIDLPGTRVFKGWQKMTRQNLEFVAWKMIVLIHKLHTHEELVDNFFFFERIAELMVNFRTIKGSVFFLGKRSPRRDMLFNPVGKRNTFRYNQESNTRKRLREEEHAHLFEEKHGHKPEWKGNKSHKKRPAQKDDEEGASGEEYDFGMEEEGPGDDLEAPPAPVPIESPSQSSRVAVRPNVFDPFSEDQPMNNKRASMDVVGPTCEYNPESMKRQRICNFPREGASPDPFLSQYPQEVFNQAPIHPTIHHLAAAASSLRDPNSSYLMHPNQQVNYDLFSDEEASAFFENM